MYILFLHYRSWFSKTQNHIDKSKILDNDFSHHNYLNLYSLCLLDTLLWLHEQYGDWTPKNDDLPPKYVFTHKTLFYWCCFTRGEIGLWIFSGCLTPDCGVCCVCRSRLSNACKNMKEKLPEIVICHPNICVRKSTKNQKMGIKVSRKNLWQLFARPSHYTRCCVLALGMLPLYCSRNMEP